MVELVIAWKGKSMGNQNSNWAETHFWKSCSDFLGKKNTQKRMPFCYAFTFFSFLTFWEQLEFFLCVWIPRFGCWLHFSHGLEVIFVMTGPGLSSSRFWSCWCIFLSCFCDFMCFYHGCEEPFTFFVVSLTFGSHALAVWGVFPLLWVVFNDKLQGCVCFLMCESFLLLCVGLCNSFFPI